MSSVSVLIVDEDPQLLRLVLEFLRDTKYVGRTAGGADEAIALLKSATE